MCANLQTTNLESHDDEDDGDDEDNDYFKKR